MALSAQPSCAPHCGQEEPNRHRPEQPADKPARQFLAGRRFADDLEVGVGPIRFSHNHEIPHFAPTLKPQTEPASRSEGFRVS